MHSPACETWQVHLRRRLPDRDRFDSDAAFTYEVLHSWEDELLVNDPEFWLHYDAMTADVRAEMDLAQRITEPAL